MKHCVCWARMHTETLPIYDHSNWQRQKKNPSTFSCIGISEYTSGRTAPRPQGRLGPLARFHRHVAMMEWNWLFSLLNLVRTWRRATATCSVQLNNHTDRGFQAGREYFVLSYICLAMSCTLRARSTRCDHTYLLSSHDRSYTVDHIRPIIYGQSYTVDHIRSVIYGRSYLSTYFRILINIWHVLLRAPFLSNITDNEGWCSDKYFTVNACASKSLPSYSLPVSASFQTTKYSPRLRNQRRHLSVHNLQRFFALK